MSDDLQIVTRTFFILLILLLMARLLGRRTLSELTFYDFDIGLVIGNIGGRRLLTGKLQSAAKQSPCLPLRCGFWLSTRCH